MKRFHISCWIFLCQRQIFTDLPSPGMSRDHIRVMVSAPSTVGAQVPGKLPTGNLFPVEFLQSKNLRIINIHSQGPRGLSDPESSQKD